MKTKFSGIVLVLGLAFAAAPAFAHHAVQAVFDYNKSITITGQIVKMEWTNPHAYMYLDSKDAAGTVHHWELELAGPGGLRKAGLSKSDRGGMKEGDTVTIGGFAAKDGTDTAWVKEITLPDGRKVVIWTNDPYGR
jgi:hypothetical protein